MPGQIGLFEDSYARIFGEQVGISEAGDLFFERFYEVFLAKSPAIEALFARTNMQRQAAMLRRSLYEFLTFYVTGKISEEMRRIAVLHQRLHLPLELYDIWLDALVETVARFDPECDERTELAWRLAMTPGITYFRLLADVGNVTVADSGELVP